MPSTQRLTQDEVQATREDRLHTWVVRIGSAGVPTDPPALIPLDGREELLIGRDMEPEVRDHWMSSQHAEVRLQDDRWILRDLGSSNGTRVFGKPRSVFALSDGVVFETGGTFWLFRQRPLAQGPQTPTWGDPLATLNPPLQRSCDQLRAVARTRVPIMLLGSTGTGKEVFARESHALSGRPGPFVAINTAAIEKNLVASELFGVVKGAHSMAERTREGQVRRADGGTLLLDEIGDMPLEVQAALLRMLQESEIVPVGGDDPIKVDVRVVCATHQDLEAMIDRGTFRADLYARLKGCRVHLPDLAARIEDVGMLIGRFMTRHGGQYASLLPAAYRRLILYPWPHNIRELERTIETALALASGGRIEAKHLPESVREHSLETPDVDDTADPNSEEAVGAELRRLLGLHKGNVSAVARAMGRSRQHVHRLLKRLELDPESFRG